MTTPVDIAPILDDGRWTGYQQALTALAALAILFDGLDIQLLGFAIPSLMRQWHVARPTFGPVLALGLGGMVVGSAFAGRWGDRYGRKPALIGCVLIFGAGTLATAFIDSLPALAILRFITGFGTGGALPNAGAIAAEFAPARRRALAVKLTIVCVPLGGMMGGLIASHVLAAFGWRALYQIGGTTPMVLAILLWLAMPESPRYLVQRSDRWPELARLLTRFGSPVPAASSFVDSREQGRVPGSSIRALFAPPLARDTVALWIAFLSCLGAIYLVFGWLPAMLSAQGANVALSSNGLAAYNFGGVVGVLIWAALITRWGSRKPLLIGTFGAAITAALVLVAHTGPAMLLVAIGLNGLLSNAVQTSMYAVAAHIYPTALRASGIAWSAALGRVGGILSSVFGASLIAAGAAPYWLSITAAMLIAFAALAAVGNHIPNPNDSNV